MLVIGSGYGFSVVCLALGLKDNGMGALTFVDPVVLVGPQRPNEDHRRRRFLARPGSGPRHFARFGVEDLVTHYKHTAEEFFARYDEFDMPQIDLAFIDGNHSYRHVQHDVVAVLKHCHKNSYFLLHDTNIYIRELLRHAGVKRWLKRKAARYKAAFEYVDFPFSSGVALVRVLEPSVWQQLS